MSERADDAAATGAAAATAAAPADVRVVDAKKVWTSLITNTQYLSGLLSLDYSLKATGTAYPLIALYTDEFPAEGHAALDRRGIAKKRVEYLLPSKHKDYSQDVRFYDCWSKLQPFSLTEYDRVVQLDSDMQVLRNMDELMELELDAPALQGTGQRVFAASHACACNPLQREHYPKEWTPANCAFTTQHATPDQAQTQGPATSAGIGMINGGLQVVNPSQAIYDRIVERLGASSFSDSYDFADQSLLSDLFKDRWVPLPYTYNALKTLRWKDVHAPIWRDAEVKNIHFILGKPWDDADRSQPSDATHAWWFRLNDERKAKERANGIDDAF